MGGWQKCCNCFYATLRCFLRFYIFIGGTIQMLFGIAVVALGIGFVILNQEFFGEATVLQTIGIITLVFGSLVLISGCCGIIGGTCKIKWCLCFFVMFCFISFSILLAISIGASYGQSWLKDNLGTTQACQSNFFSIINDPIATVEQYWCNKNAGCPCYISQQKISQWNSDSTKYNYLQQNIQPYNTPSQNQIRDVMNQQCQDGINNYLQGQSTQVNWDSLEFYQHLYNYLEENYQCSGFCTPAYVYTFSDSDTTPPKNYPNNSGCYVYFYDKFHNFVGKIIFPFWFLTVLYAGNLVTSYFIMCTPKRRKQFFDDGQTNLEQNLFQGESNSNGQSLDGPKYSNYNELTINTTNSDQYTQPY
ncbi:hypothetical protein PPERSA_00302 [Pseudocohnilembus persalinus]|uniref:Tetraspanin/Peripherin n=1 Tax=Pseudocohnilembus persalinus TaxID=266149 RepID=A0A0V0Q970_PSEPJ|nr:hypothetical protein PPERSA_00302 [Pseudocohnilembus persalinus]|eukprot:KRW98714.1 hypothetical protein PPERSA_00302 [Pseudocohnilembus persalinus]